MEGKFLHLDAMVQGFSALGHPARLSILQFLVQGPEAGTPEGEIQAHLGIPGSTLSHHLSDLAEAGLVKATRYGTVLRYAACFNHLKELMNYLWTDCCDRNPDSLLVPEAGDSCCLEPPSPEPNQKSVSRPGSFSRKWRPEQD